MVTKKTLKGLYFLEYENEKIQKRGTVVDVLTDNLILVEYRSWLDGEPTGCQIRNINNLENLSFYYDLEYMNQIVTAEEKRSEREGGEE